MADDALARENSSLRKAIHAALVTRYEGGPRPWWEPLEAALGINPEPPKMFTVEQSTKNTRGTDTWQSAIGG